MFFVKRETILSNCCLHLKDLRYKMGSTVDGFEILLTTWNVNKYVSNGINYQLQLVRRIFSVHNTFIANYNNGHSCFPFVHIVVSSKILHRSISGCFHCYSQAVLTIRFLPSTVLRVHYINIYIHIDQESFNYICIYICIWKTYVKKLHLPQSKLSNGFF